MRANKKDHRFPFLKVCPYGSGSTFCPLFLVRSWISTLVTYPRGPIVSGSRYSRHGFRYIYHIVSQSLLLNIRYTCALTGRQIK